jgi:hypothetical protein
LVFHHYDLKVHLIFKDIYEKGHGIKNTQSEIEIKDENIIIFCILCIFISIVTKKLNILSKTNIVTQ